MFKQAQILEVDLLISTNNQYFWSHFFQSASIFCVLSGKIAKTDVINRGAGLFRVYIFFRSKFDATSLTFLGGRELLVRSR